MRYLIFLAVLIFIIISSIQTRSLKYIPYDLGMSRKYFINPPSYSNLLTSSNMNQKSNSYQNIVDNNNSHQDNDDMTLRKLKPLISADRRFFLFSTSRSKHRNPSPPSYGRKSHWDTFFG